MSARLLTSDEDLKAVSDFFLDLTHVAMPLEYLKRGIVEGWYIAGQLAAAYACILKPPYRVLSVLGEDQLDCHLKECLGKGLVCEFNGVFVRPEFKDDVHAGSLMKTALRTFIDSGMKCALFGYSNERDNLATLYQRRLLSPVKLLDGEVVLPSGVVSVSNVFLGYFRSDHIARAFRFREPGEEKELEMVPKNC